MIAGLKGIIKARSRKLEALQKAGVNPYPAQAKRTGSIGAALADFSVLAGKKESVSLAGRIMAARGHGKACFVDLKDFSGQIQVLVAQDRVGQEKYQIWQNIEPGDFVSVSGILFITKAGEKSLEAQDFQLLVKALLPLPEKRHGLKNKEQRLRKRYLDLLTDESVKQRFVGRSKIIKALREFMENNGFIEVETSILQPIPGGATARPFKTRLNALAMDLYLRVAPELYLKRLLVGGLEKVYEIGRCFRNEGIDFSHNPDFTMIEFYWAYADYEMLMSFTEKLIMALVDLASNGKNEIVYRGQTIKFKPPFKRLEFSQIAKNDDELKEARKKIIEPCFIINHPLAISPLAKRLDTDPNKAARFQLIVAGMEIVNAFSELNDPSEQAERFKAQEKLRTQGDKEAQRLDQDFIEALKYGMPPAAGFGMGIDRIVALLTGAESLREAILFPTMREK